MDEEYITTVNEPGTRLYEDILRAFGQAQYYARGPYPRDGLLPDMVKKEPRVPTKRKSMFDDAIRVDFDVVEYVNKELKTMLEEELERELTSKANPIMKEIEVTEKKTPELDVTVNLTGPVDPDSYNMAMAAAKKSPGCFGVLSVTGGEAGYIQSVEIPEEVIVRDDRYYLERMEEIVEKAEEHLKYEAPGGDTDLLQDKNGEFIFFNMYSEILHARSAFNINVEYAASTPTEAREDGVYGYGYSNEMES